MNSIAMNYEKISDDLFLFGNNYILRFNVQLARKNADGNRQIFQSEYQYESSKYTNVNELVTVRRSFDYFLSIETIRSSDAKLYLPIYLQDFMQFRDKVMESTKWFQSEEFKNLFAKDGDDIVILGKVEPIIYSSLFSKCSIKWEPVVIKRETECKLGIRMSFNEVDTYSEIEFDRYMGLVYLVSNLNMYQSAQMILNYVQPHTDTHRVSLSNDGERYQSTYKKAVSFFDK